MILFLFACSQEKTTETVHTTELETALIEAIEQDMEETGATAFSMAVLKNGEISWSRGFGEHTKNGSPVTENTLFRVASITKPMTAVLALQQIELGCLGLQNKVDDYIDGFVMTAQPNLSSSLTVENTLTMTGGFVDYQLQSGEDGDGQIELFLSTFLENAYFLSPPGEMYNYSNPNFVVAGHLVERCTNQYFRTTMEEQLWAPINMNQTTFQTSEIISDNSYAIGVTEYWPNQVGEEVAVDAERYGASHLWPAMGAWSSAEDLAKFGLFLMQGDESILSAHMLEEMTTIQVDTEEGYENKGYGYGINVKTGISIGGENYPVTMLSHTGSIYGYSSHMYLIPELEVGVVAIINRDNATPKNSIPVALGLHELVETYEPNLSVSDSVTDYIGSYHNNYNIGTMNLSETEEGLRIEIPALDDANIDYVPILEPIRPDNFHILYPDGSYDLLSFLRDGEGAVEYLRSRNYVGEKVSISNIAPVEHSHNEGLLWSTLEKRIHID